MGLALAQRMHVDLCMRQALIVSCLLIGGCSGVGDDLDLSGELYPNPPMGKEDSVGKAGPKVANDTRATQVWYATNNWEDLDTEAGIAWGTNSGLSWNQKYELWIKSMEETASISGYDTFVLTTPWGKTMPAPILECAETAIFLRATFAAWYNLPFFMEARDSSGQRIFFGHFGIWTATSKWGNTPNFAYDYSDYSSWTSSQLSTNGWPSDSRLRTKTADGGEDEQTFLGAGTHFGAYLDEVHLNKRAGYLIIYLLNYFGSMNLADSSNTFNLVPEAIKEGDVLLHRWQKDGIGDTKIIKIVGENAAGTMTAKLMSGSMPRRQAKIYDEVNSKGYFTSEDTGGPGENADGDAYWKLGGGAKRWRVTKNLGGYWTNTWMAADEASWINDQDEARISARPGQFEVLLGEVSPSEKRDALLVQIGDSRDHLMRYPASCAARERRERAFEDLYDLAYQLGTTKSAMDAQYRDLSDYVFAELSYTQSKTCCWNSSTAAMSEIIMSYATKEQEGTCLAPTVFKATGGGYDLWATYAAEIGRQTDWRAWSEDEPCSQGDVTTDTETAHEAEAWCTVDGGSGSTSGCTDAYESNDSLGSAKSVANGTISAQVCSGDHDYFAITQSSYLSVTLSFTHSQGDLDMELYSPSGSLVTSSASVTDQEVITLSGLAAGTYKVHVYGYDGATNDYSLSVTGY